MSLGRLAELRRSTSEGSVIAVLARYFHDRNVGEVAAVEGFLAARLRAGSCLVLFDGLDEVRAEDRAVLRGWLESFSSQFPENRWVVTSRVAGYRGIELPGAVEVVVRPWGEEQVKRYLLAFHRSYRVWETGQEDAPSARREAERSFESLRAHGLLGLARNPFLASALALIHRAEGSLPRHRVQVYETFARALCETWSSARRLVAGREDPSLRYEEEALPLLGRLALALHTGFPWGSAPEDFVLETLVETLEEKDVASEIARRAAGKFLERAAEEAGILYERRPPRGGSGGPQPGEWAFLHLTFQDFFVAAGLHAEERFEDLALQHLFEPNWLEVIRLGVGYYVLVQKRPRAALKFIERVAGFRLTGKRSWITDVLHKQVPMALMLAAEAGDAVPPRIRKELAEKFFRWQYFPPLETIESIIDRISGTELGEEVVRGVDFQNASFDDLAQEYEGDILETDSAATISAASKGEEAIEVLLRLLERESGNLGPDGVLKIDEPMDTTALGALALSQLWRISGGL